MYQLINEISTSGILLCKWDGTLDAKSVQPLLEELRDIESKNPKPFLRYNDFTHLESIQLTIADISSITATRQKHYNGPFTRSAMCSPDPTLFGLMRMYGGMIYPTPIEVQVFYNHDDSAKWLGIKADELKKMLQ